MTIGSILRQIQTMAGDTDGTKTSMEFLLSAFSDEMRFCMVMFPQQVSISSVPMTGNSPTTASILDHVNPKYVWSGDVQCQKVYASDMLSMLSAGTPSISGYWWCMMEGVLNVMPAGADVRVVGDLYLKNDYTTNHLSHSLEVVATAYGTSPNFVRPGLTGGPLAIVRYRTAQRVAEFIGDFNRAQYFLQVAVRKEAETRATSFDRSTTSLGAVLGSDL